MSAFVCFINVDRESVWLRCASIVSVIGNAEDSSVPTRVYYAIGNTSDSIEIRLSVSEAVACIGNAERTNGMPTSKVSS